MIAQLMNKVNEANKKKDIAKFAVGDTVRVYATVREGDKDRIQVFRGILIARRGSGATETVTVRRVSHGVGVERVFPVHSPLVTKIKVEKSWHVRRAKLYYLRNLSGKKARLREKRTVVKQKGT